MKYVKITVLLIACFIPACQRRYFNPYAGFCEQLEEQNKQLNSIFSAEWIEKGALWRHAGYKTDPNYLGVYFGMYFRAQNHKTRTAVVQEIMFIEGSMKDTKKGVWYIDAGSQGERILKYNLDESLKGVITGEYGWDWEEPNNRIACDYPRPIVAKPQELDVSQKAHWKFKTYLVEFDFDKSVEAGRWREGITDVLAVIDWEIMAELLIDPNTGEPFVVAFVYPENPVMRISELNEIKWNVMPSAKKAWDQLLEKIKLGPKTNGETNIWHYQYGYLYERYPKKFWE